MSKACPSTIKSQTTLKGIAGTEGAVDRVELADGSSMEIETALVDRKTLRVEYKVLKTDIKCFQNIQSVTEVFTMTPVSFCGCLFNQALVDMQQKGHQCMTVCKWETKLLCDDKDGQVFEIQPDQIEEIRCCKLNQIADFTRELKKSKSQQMLNCHMKMNSQCSEDKELSKVPLGCCGDGICVDCPPCCRCQKEGYTLSEAQKDVEKYYKK